MDDEDENIDAELPAVVLDSKIVEYEAFIENVLKNELKRSLDEYRKHAELLEQCRQLRKNLEFLQQEKITELETMVEIGCQFFAKAFVPNTSRIFIDVGLGFRLEMSLGEAFEFLGHKEAYILSGLELRKNKTARIKADVHEALHLLDLMSQVKTGGAPWLASCNQNLIDSFSG